MAPERSERPSEFGPSLGSQVLSTEPLTAFGAHVVRWEPWHRLSQLNRSGPLHLDARLHPERRHSVLLFLSGTGKAKDGATVWLGWMVEILVELGEKKTGDGIEIYRLFAFG